MRNLRAKTISSIGWVLGSQIGSQAISFGFGIALARLLVPDDFGLIAMVMVFTGLASLVLDVGLGSALVQKKDVSEKHFSSVFWINILLGCILGSLLFVLSPWLSTFYERPEIEGICKVLSVSFPIGALAMVTRTRFVKEMSFKYIALSNLAALAASGAIAVALAATGFGYWSLVVQQLLKLAFSTTLIWFLSDWRPTREINRDAIRELFGFSASIFATRLLQYGAVNVDKLLLGKVLGGEALGVYDRAHSMMLFPLQNISHTVSSVMFPSLSLIQSDKMRVRKIYLRSTKAIALLTFPMMAGMFTVAESFVLGVLGPNWVELIPVLRVLCIAGAANSIITVTGVLYQSQGAAALQLRVNLITQPLRIAALVAGLPWGLLGVATGYTAASFITGFITLTVAGRLVDLRLFTLLQSLAPILPPTLIMAVSVWAIRLALGVQNELYIFLVQTVAGGGIYFVCVVMMRVKAYQDVFRVFRDEFVSRRNTKR